MLSWSLGGYPSPNLEIAQEFAVQPGAEPNAVLDRVARRRFGAGGAPHARRAWTAFSRAFREYPFHVGVLYQSPVQVGPANLLYLSATHCRATMTGIPYDDLDGWRGPYPAEVFAGQFAKLAELWRGGLSELEQAAAKAPADRAAEARAELRFARAAGLHFASVAEQARFAAARNALAGLPRPAAAERREMAVRMREAAKSDARAAHELFRLAREDSRLGYEAANQYFYLPIDLMEKVVNCRWVEDRLAGEVVHGGKAGEDSDRWSAGNAWAWYKKQPWRVGCNFVPSTAVNDVEMWQTKTFDPKTIDRELGWAQDLGFNTLRVFVNYAVWEADADGLKDRFRQFLDIAGKHGMSVMVVLFDDCFKPEPRVGKQDDPVPGVHNSQWVQSPGARRRGDRMAWPKLEQYVKDMAGTFGSDKRVLAWELYNEPTASLPLVEAAFRWAREAKPSQPVTTTVFGDAEMQKRIIELSDVLCFHNYGTLPGVKAQAAGLLRHGRPVLCTEWMARPMGSRFETHLPYFKEQRIACWNWGLVNGRTQTQFPWGGKPGAIEPELVVPRHLSQRRHTV